MARRAPSEYIAEAVSFLAQAKANLEQQRRIVAHRRELGTDLTESLTLLETMDAIVRRRERRLAFLRGWYKQKEG
jgi:hypothetical protein